MGKKRALLCYKITKKAICYHVSVSLRITADHMAPLPYGPKLCKCPYQTGAKWPTSCRAILYHNRWMDFSQLSLVSAYSSHTGPSIPDIIWYNWVLQSICPSTNTKRRTLTGSINLLIPHGATKTLKSKLKSPQSLLLWCLNGKQPGWPFRYHF